jgi:hypothetical protein
VRPAAWKRGEIALEVVNIDPMPIETVRVRTMQRMPKHCAKQ